VTPALPAWNPSLPMDLVTRESHAFVTARLRGFAILAPLAAPSRPTPVVSGKSLQYREIHHYAIDGVVSSAGVALALCCLGAVGTKHPTMRYSSTGCRPPWSRASPR
jgi:hypothetical protein